MDESLGLPAGFMEQLGSGVGANLITVCAVAVLLCIRNCSKRKFKHSECKSCCFSLELDEQSEESSESEKSHEIKHKKEKAKKDAKEDDRSEGAGNIV